MGPPACKSPSAQKLSSKLESASRNHFSRLVGRSAVLLALASAAFIIPGMVRTKFSAVYFGDQGIALFGQLSQLQTLFISVGAAGLVTATRVVLSRPNQSPDQIARLLSWCLWIPFIGSLGLAGAVAVFGQSISVPLLGTSSFGGEVAFAALGIPFAVAGQISIAGAQAQGNRWMLLISAAGSALAGSLVVWACMSTGDQVAGTLSLVAAPAIQLFFVLSICAPVRRAVFRLPWINRRILREIFVIAWASALLSIFAAAAELLARTAIVHFHGLAALAVYQPSATLVTQLVSIALSALATASLIELSQVTDRRLLGRVISGLESKFVPLIGLFCGLLLSASPFLVATFFHEDLWRSAYPLIAVSVAFEPVRAAVWLAGSALLPSGMRMAWLLNGLLSVLTQVLIVLTLASSLGAISLSIGFACANVLSLVVTLALLRRKGIVVAGSALVIPLVLAASLLSFAMWDQRLLNLAVAGPLLYSAVLALGIWGARGWSTRRDAAKNREVRADHGATAAAPLAASPEATGEKTHANS